MMAIQTVGQRVFGMAGNLDIQGADWSAALLDKTEGGMMAGQKATEMADYLAGKRACLAVGKVGRLEFCLVLRTAEMKVGWRAVRMVACSDDYLALTMAVQMVGVMAAR
jgi:hypothetical protein